MPSSPQPYRHHIPPLPNPSYPPALPLAATRPPPLSPLPAPPRPHPHRPLSTVATGIAQQGEREHNEDNGDRNPPAIPRCNQCQWPSSYQASHARRARRTADGADGDLVWVDGAPPQQSGTSQRPPDGTRAGRVPQSRSGLHATGRLVAAELPTRPPAGGARGHARPQSARQRRIGTVHSQRPGPGDSNTRRPDFEFRSGLPQRAVAPLPAAEGPIAGLACNSAPAAPRTAPRPSPRTTYPPPPPPPPFRCRCRGSRRRGSRRGCGADGAPTGLAPRGGGGGGGRGVAFAPGETVFARGAACGGRRRRRGGDGRRGSGGGTPPWQRDDAPGGWVTARGCGTAAARGGDASPQGRGEADAARRALAGDGLGRRVHP